MVGCGRSARGIVASRRYGYTHRVERERWRRLVEQGQVCCRRCGGWIAPGSAWDLGHDDRDEFLPRHPEHASCNRRTATWKALRRQTVRADAGEWL